MAADPRADFRTPWLRGRAHPRYDVVLLICAKLEPYPAGAGEVITKEGKIGKEMYILIRGAVRVSQLVSGAEIHLGFLKVLI